MLQWTQGFELSWHDQRLAGRKEMSLAATCRAQPKNTIRLVSRPSLSRIQIDLKWAQLILGQLSGPNQPEMQGLSAKRQRLSAQRMTKDALSARLALSERTVFQGKKIISYNSILFSRSLKPLYLSFKNKLIYANVMIMKQVPHQTMHKKTKQQKLELGCLPRSASLTSLA